MNPSNPIFSFFAILVAISTCFFIASRVRVPVAVGRYASIDGLSGYLAFAVFLHHSAVWYFYLHTGKWAVPPSNFYTHLGQTSVALFFMITGFLFYTKLIESRSSGIDWGKFFISRLLRLLPLYLFAMLLLVLITIYRSNGTLNEPAWAMVKNLIKWLTFTMFGAPDLNGLSDTWIVMAGVTWSLPYEWFFYLALPVIALTVRSVPPTLYFLIGVVGLAFAFKQGLEMHNLLAFGGGIFSALAVRDDSIRNIAASKIASPILIACFIIVVSLFPTAYGYPQLALISVAFTLIAAGCSLYGVFTNVVSKTLGEMAYSIYLLHGIILFTVINLLVGVDNAARMSPLSYWILIIGVTPMVILISFTTFTRIERPSMNRAPNVTAWLRRRFSKEVLEPTLSTPKSHPRLF